MPQSSTTQSFVDQLRAEGLARGLSPNEVEMRLARAGYVPMPQGGAGGGYGMLANLGRQIGAVGERGAVEGLGNLVGLPFSMAGAAYQAATGSAPPQMLQPQGAAVANQLGLPQPQTGGERIAKEAVSGAAASLPFAAAGAVGPVAGGLLGAGAGAAGQGMAEAGVGPLGQAVASMAVGMGLPMVGFLGAKAIRAMLVGSESRRAAAKASMDLLQAGNPNAPVTLGQVAEGGIARTAEGALRHVPGASGTIRGTLDDQAEVMKARVERVADRISPAGTAETAGAAMQTGIKEGFIPRFKAASGHLYRRAFRLVPPETPVIPNNTIRLANEQENIVALAKPLRDATVVDPTVKSTLDDIAKALEERPGGIPFVVLKELRSRLGAMLDGDVIVPNINLRDVKRLYGTLSDDMRTAIAAQGDDALRAWDKAEDFYRQGTEKIEKILQPLINKKEPEKAFMALISGSKEGATALRTTLKSLRGEERRMVVATVLRRLGKANPSAQDAASEVFSPETFLTRWASLSKEARTALFDGFDPGLTRDINHLAKAMELQRQAARALPNPSGTASNTAFMAILSGLSAAGGGALTGSMGGAGLSAALAPAMAAGAGKFAAERIFTNPNMIRWLVKQTKVPFGALSQELAILARDSQKWDDPEGQEIAREMVDTFGNMDWSQILLASAVADAARVQ